MCMVDSYDGDWVPFARRMRKARKEHKCAECARTIAAGETYAYDSGLTEGEFSDSKTCAHCLIACAWLQRECHGYFMSMVMEDVQEHFDCLDVPDMPRFWLGRVLVGAKRKWRRFDGAGLMPVPVLHERTSHAR